MTNRMQEYFNAQPEALLVTLQKGRLDVQTFAKTHRNFQRLYLIGSGSSFYCAQMTQDFLRGCLGCEVTALLPGQAEQHRFLSEDLLVLITQEGKSVNVMNVANKLNRDNNPFSVLTAIPASPIAQMAQSCLSLHCGEENVGPKTQGVLSTLFMLTLLGAELGLARQTLDAVDCEKCIVALQKTLDLLSQNMQRCRDWVSQNASVLMKAPFIAAVSTPPLCLLGCEGALKIVETLYIPAISYEFEEFIHGPHCLVGTDMVVLALYHGLPGEDRLRSLCAFVREKGGQVLEVSDLDESHNFDGLRLFNSGNEICPLHFLLPFQAAAAFLAPLMGHDLNRPKFPGFATALKSKLY